jgi:2-methylcitrate dehydratase PrpD
MTNDTLPSGITTQLVYYIHAARFADLPDSARHAARRAFVNILGCCLGGADHEIVETASRAMMPFAGLGTTTVLGRPERADMLTATLLNALSSAAYSFDDTHAEAIIHPSGAVAATLLALAEQQVVTGEEFMLAFVLGVDVACRLSKAVSVAPARGDIAWSQTGIAAGVGAAVAAAKLLRLEPEAMAWAIGIAASQGSGFRVTHGSMCATLIFGHAAQTGLRAALLAREGMTAPVGTLEGKYGYTSVFASEPHLAYLTDGLDARFEIEALTYKPYPCGVVIHPAVDAALEWHHAHRAQPDAIAKVHLRMHASALALGFRRHPAGTLEAKVSLFHWVAVALTYGRATLLEGRQQTIDEPLVHSLRELMEVGSEDGIAVDSAVMKVVLTNGEQHSVHISHCKGSLARPMSDADLDEKFRGQAEPSLSADTITRLLGQCWKIDHLQDTAEIVRLTREGR